MEIQLLAATPCKRFDYQPMCEDGRGGWVYSQVGADRYIANLDDLWLLIGFSVRVAPSDADDYVEKSRLVATMEGQVIGDSTLDWTTPNKGGAFHSDSMIYEWMQDVDLLPTQEGLISVNVELKLHSRETFHSVNGRAYCHITQRDTNDEQVSPSEYRIRASDVKRSWNEANGRWSETPAQH